MADILMHFKDADGNVLTSKTHGVVKLITARFPNGMLPADSDPTEDNPATPKVEGDGSELVYRFANIDIVNGIVESTNPKGLQLSDLYIDANPDADETGQAFS